MLKLQDFYSKLVLKLIFQFIFLHLSGDIRKLARAQSGSDDSRRVVDLLTVPITNAPRRYALKHGLRTTDHPH